MLKGGHDEGAYGRAGGFSAAPEPVVEELRDVDRGPDGHDMIMSQILRDSPLGAPGLDSETWDCLG